MKILKIIFIVLIVLVVLVVGGLFIAIEKVDVNQFREQITENLSDALGRQVTIDHIELDFSFGEGLRFLLKDLAVKDNASFSDGSMLKANSVYLRADVVRLLTQQQLLIMHVLIENPDIRIIKNKEEELNIVSFSEEIATGSDTKNTKTQKKAKRAIFDPQNTRINHVKITNGSLTYSDLSDALTVKNLTVSRINIGINDFGFNRIFPYSLSCAIFNKKENIQLKGEAKIDTNSTAIQIRNVSFKTNLADFKLTELYEIIPQLVEIGIHRRLEGHIDVHIDNLTLGAKGLERFSAEGRLTDGEVSLSVLAYPIDNIDVLIQIEDSKAVLKDMNLYFASGRVFGHAVVKDFLKTNQFAAKVEFENLSLTELLEKQKLPASVEGKVQGDLDIKGKFAQTNFYDSLQGSMNVEVIDGVIKDVNILKIVLDKINFIPNLRQQVEANLSEENREKLTKNNTTLNVVKIDNTIAGRTVKLNDVHVDADGFVVKANGKVSVAQELSLRSKVFIPKDLSADMIRAVAELKALLSQDGQITIPMQDYKGPLAKFRTFPDIGDVATKILEQKGKEELQKAFRKVFDINEKKPQEPQEGETPNESQPNTPSPEEVIINDVLDILF